MMQPTPAEELRLDQMGVDDTLRRRLRDLLQVDQGCVTRRRGMKVASTDGVWRKPWRQLFGGGAQHRLLRGTELAGARLLPWVRAGVERACC